VVLAAVTSGVVYLAASRRRALGKSERQRDAIIDALPDLVMQTRADGSIQAVHGGRRASVSPELEARLAPEIEKAMRASESTSFEMPVATDGKGDRWLEVRVSAMASQEGLAIVRDVTDRHLAEADQKKLELQLRHAQRMDAIGQLAGGLAHDFNNLMTAVIAHGELARDSASIDAETREDIDHIIVAARRAAQLTKRLLTFSRRQSIDPKPMSFGDLVKSLDSMIRRLVREAIEVEVRVDPKPCWIIADPGQIEQVIMNLVVNAADAIPVTGKIEITVVPKGESDVELMVRDSGEGMSREVQERLFEPYFTTKDVGKGSGLGLAIVYGVVTQARGRVSVDSALGEGTTVRVVLPTTKAPTAAQVLRSSSPDVEMGTGTVLLVEDDPLVRKAALRGLEKAGYTVVEAQDGSEAVGILAQRRGDIKVVVTDLVMPVMGGRELVQWMTRNHPEVPVVLTSGYAEDTAGLSERVSTFLSKPYSPAELSKAIRDAISGHPQSSG